MHKEVGSAAGPRRALTDCERTEFCQLCRPAGFTSATSNISWSKATKVCRKLYKSLFTKENGSTQKHSSESINTNKAKTVTKSITVVDTCNNISIICDDDCCTIAVLLVLDGSKSSARVYETVERTTTIIAFQSALLVRVQLGIMLVHLDLAPSNTEYDFLLVLRSTVSTCCTVSEI